MSTAREETRKQIQLAHPGIEENVPFALPGIADWVGIWRGSKVMLRRKRSGDIIAKPGEAEGALANPPD